MPAQISHDGRGGRSSLIHLLKRMIIFYPTPPFLCGTGNRVSEASWSPWAKRGDQENRNTGPSCWHLVKTRGLLDVCCPLVQSSFLPNQSPLAKYWGRQPPWCVSIVKAAQKGRKNTLSCADLILFFSFCLCFCLCLLYFSLYYRIHFFLNFEHHMNMSHGEPQWSTGRVQSMPWTLVSHKVVRGWKGKYLRAFSLCNFQEGPLDF